MKVAVAKKLLYEAVCKGGAAALSDDAEKSTSALSPLIQSLTIVANGDFTVNSHTDRFATQFTIPVQNTSDLKVDEQGEGQISAKYLRQWLEGLSNDANIGLKLKAHDKTQYLSLQGEIEDFNRQGASLGVIGALQLQAVAGDGKSADGVDCYDVSQGLRKVISFETLPPKSFSIEAKKMQDIFQNVSIAAKAKDYEHIYDTVAFIRDKDCLYVTSSDAQRCCVWTLKNMGQNLNLDDRCLVNRNLLSLALKCSDPDHVLDFHYDPKESHLYIIQPHMAIRLMTTAHDETKRFPNINSLINAKYIKAASIKRSSLALRLNKHVTLVNKVAALFSFKGSALIITARSELGKKTENVNTLPVSPCDNEADVVLNVEHVEHFLKSVKSEMVEADFMNNSPIGCVRLYTDEIPELSCYLKTHVSKVYQQS